MDSSTKVIVNTIAQYIKTFINIILTLYSTRLILNVLGVGDFGLYSLVAGVVSMLSFATNALATTTQRFLSYHQGKSDREEQKSIFANSFYIHVGLGVATFIVLILLIPLLFDGLLNIPYDRMTAAKCTYIVVAFILLVTFITTPFRAVLISHENIVFLTIIDIIDGFFKVFLAIGLYYVTIDRLVCYSIMLCLIQLFNLSVIGLYALKHYEECILPSISRVNRQQIKDIASFAGWSVYNVGCVMGRTQGIAIVINRFFGSAVNAAYGLGFQVGGYINFMSESLLNAIRPQMMRSEGEGDRQRMLRLSEIASKYSFFLLSSLAIPCIMVMPELLHLWLGEVPEYAALFCRMVLMATVVDSLTSGLMIANQAIGNIKQYSLAVNTTKIITLPVALICVYVGLPLFWVALVYVCFELICAVVRIPFVAKTGGLNIGQFIKNVFVRLFLPFSIFTIVSFWLAIMAHLHFLIVFFVAITVYCIAFYFLGVTKYEREIFYGLVRKNKK